MFKNLIVGHIRACLFSLGRLLRTPVSTILTVVVIGISLALPASLYLVLKNIQGVSNAWDSSSTQISLYLHTGLSKKQTNDLLQQHACAYRVKSESLRRNLKCNMAA